MPPCAAIECARRGLSWKTKHFTLYPRSASDEAQDEPARPAPTTITSYFRLLAGLTSLMSALCFRHLSASGPDGTLESSVAMAGSDLGVDVAAEHGERDGRVQEEIEPAVDRREAIQPPGPF